MGKKASVNKTYIIPDQYKELRTKYLKNISSLPFYKYTQEDINKINFLYKEKLDKDGVDVFNEVEFINSLPKLDPFGKKIFLHLFKILFEGLSTTLQGDYPDVKQFFIIYIIYLLCNPKLDKNKFVLANMIDFYLKRPKKEKKVKKKKKDDEKIEEKVHEKEQDLNILDKEDVNNFIQEPKVAIKKKLNLYQIYIIIKYLYTFTRTSLIYYALMFVFMFDSLKKDDYLFDSDKAKVVDGETIYDLEFTFLTNFGLINREYNLKQQEKIWIDYILEPLSGCKYIKFYNILCN